MSAFLDPVWMDAPFETLDSLRCQFQDEESAITDKAVVRCACYRDAVVEEWRVLDCVALEALGVKFEHCEAGLVRPSATMLRALFTHMQEL